jgi:hypothetical protein
LKVVYSVWENRASRGRLRKIDQGPETCEQKDTEGQADRDNNYGHNKEESLAKHTQVSASY